MAGVQPLVVEPSTPMAFYNEPFNNRHRQVMERVIMAIRLLNRS